MPGAWEKGQVLPQQVVPESKRPIQRGVLIAIPIGGLPLMHMNWAVSFAQMVSQTAASGIPTQTLTIKHYGVTESRNLLIHKFLKSNSMSHLLFLDSDVIPSSDAIVRLMNHNVPVVVGVIHDKKREGKSLPALWVKTDKPSNYLTLSLANDKSRLYEIAWSCLGLVLIERRVLEAIKPPWCRYTHETEYDSAGEPIKGMSEDRYLFDQIEKAGFKCMADLNVRARHIGMAAIGPDDTVIDWI